MRFKEAAWYLIGFLLIAGIVFGAYHSCLNVGYLLDDYYHLGYISKAFNGDPSGLITCLTGKWSGPVDGLTTFRPGVSLSFIPDFLIWGLNPIGYHITNLIVFAGCAFWVAVMTFELTRTAPSGDGLAVREKPLSLVAALAAGALFVLYPIHPESVAWIIGRVDVHCSFFYLASINFYFFSRRTGNHAWFAASLISFLCALTCKEMAVTLPAVIAIAEILLAKPLGWKSTTLRSRVIAVASFFALLAAFAVLRTLLIGTLVGGYGSTNLKSFFRTLKNFLDAVTFNKLLFGLNEEQPFDPKCIELAKWAWIAVAAGLIASLTQNLNRLRTIAFLILWLVVAQLPTFQIWHIYPNLVGSRLFYLGSAALCALLSVCLIAPWQYPKKLDELFQRSPLPKFFVLAIRVFSVAGLAVLSSCWYLGLQHNLEPWVEATRQMETLRRQLIEANTTAPADKFVAVLDLPQDYAGAGLIGRPEYLRIMLTEPVSDKDHTGKLIILERPIPGSHEFAYTSLVDAITSDARISKVLRWDKDKKQYVEWTKSSGAGSFAVAYQQPSTPAVEKPSTMVENPTEPKIIWFDHHPLNPIAQATFELSLKTDQPLDKIAPNVRLVWRSKNQPQSWIDYSEGPWAEVVGDRLLFIPNRYRSWVFNGDIQQLGVEFYPGTYATSIRELRSGRAEQIMPVVSLYKNEVSSKQSLQDMVLPSIDTASGIMVDYDARSIPNAKSASLYITSSEIPFFDQPTKALPDSSNLILTQKLDSLRGQFKLPPSAYEKVGKHQVAVMAFDDKDQPAGYLSEPRTYLVLGR